MSRIHTFRSGPATLLSAGLTLLLTISGSGLGAKDEKKKKIVIAEPSRAKEDADFLVQGEYSGLLKGADGTARNFGVQVVAGGNGQFRAVGYVGGLPGDGWDGSERLSADGATVSGVTGFERLLGGASIREGKMKITDVGAETVSTLKRVVRKSPTLGAKPPENAVVLFDGERNDFAPGDTTPDGLLTVPRAPQRSRHVFAKDFSLHLEFRTPYQPNHRGQGRGNSGVHLQGRYEIQVLDSFGEKGTRHECGAFYGFRAPDVNMCFPPLTWQTYDVDYRVARFDEKGEVVTPPVVTVRHNGVVVHKDVRLEHRRKPRREGGDLRLQWHDNPVRYRNIWAVEK